MKIIKFKNINIFSKDDSLEIYLDSERIVFNNSYLFDSFTDSHGHLLALGKKLSELDLSDCRSLNECLAKVRNHKNQKGKWIVGRGWNNELWEDSQLPNRYQLDELFPNIPIMLVRVDGHCAWINSEAIRITKLDAEIKKINQDAKLDFDTEGLLTGIIYDYAIDYVKKFIPEYDKNDKKELILKGSYELLRKGITTINDMDVHPSLIPLFKELDDVDKLPIKIYSFISGNKNEWIDYDVKPYFGKNYSVIGVKFFADGSLGSRTAALLSDYEDDKSNKGLFLNDEKNLFEQCKIALNDGFQVATHAIGDAANRMVLKVYAKLFSEGIANKNSILRVEHAQHIHPDDLIYFKKYPIIASIQPIHCISDAATISEKRLGKRCDYAYPWKSILRQKAKIISGSDFPIENCNPFEGIKAYLFRIPFGKNKSWYPQECLNLQEALDSYITIPEKVNNFGHKKTTKSSKGKIIIDKPINALKNHEKINIRALIFDNKFFKF